MICTVIQNKTLEAIAALLEDNQVEMAEIRLDRCPLDEEDIEILFSASDIPLIATCRLAEGGPDAEKRLLKAIEAGAKYCDLEIEAPAPVGKRIRKACRDFGTVLIRSWHDHAGTPPLDVLEGVAERCRRFGGEVLKIVTTAQSEADCARILALYDSHEPAGLVAFAMGEAGRASRLECLRRGAPFTYAALAEGDESAPGQPTTAALRQSVYGDFRFIATQAPLTMPAAKSFAQRAILAAALAEGTSRLSGYSPCGDNEAAVAVARALGARVTQEGDTLCIEGIAATAGSGTPEQLHAGESGLLARLLIPLAAALSPTAVSISGEKSLLGRPLAGAHELMAAFGITLQSQSERPMPRKVDCLVPLTVKGPLIPGRAEISGKDGSQLISGLLTALPLCAGKSSVFVREPKSIPYLFITLDVLKKFGIEIVNEMEGDADFLETQDWALCTGMRFSMNGGQRLHAADLPIEGDWSGAAAFLVAGAVFGAVTLEGLDTTSLQADLSILDILMEAGASLSQLEGPEGNPATGPLHARRAPLNRFEVDANHCPDLFPIIAVLAAFCPGTSRIAGVGRLTHKESDRAAAIVDMLTQMGVDAWTEADTLCVDGLSLPQRLLSGQLLHGGHYSAHGDHRMVMALKVASLGADAPVIIDDEACVAKSFPHFHELFGQL